MSDIVLQVALLRSYSLNQDQSPFCPLLIGVFFVHLRLFLGALHGVAKLITQLANVLLVRYIPPSSLQ
jgi:hypothetical protein